MHNKKEAELVNVIMRLEQRGPFFWVVAGFVLVLGVGIVDLLTGYELAFSLFYFLPVSLVAWFGGRNIGIAISVVSGICWFGADHFAGHPYSHPAIPYWNAAIRFSVFLTVAILVSALRRAHDHEKELARIDGLTGAVNVRFFYELLRMEIDRTQRTQRPFTIVYLDLDNFKQVNDHNGHSVGDKVLYAVVDRAKSQLRRIDVVARLGGDEFAFLLPETDQSEARVVISKVQIGMLEEMRRNNWPVTFSIGVLTCFEVPKAIDELIKQADALMYSVKNSGKNAIRYAIYAE